MRPLLLDAYCGAGGAAMGYHRAGFEVVGVDIVEQPHYPFTFIRANAIELLADSLELADVAAIHASPPCQAYSRSATYRADADERWHSDLVGPTRHLLDQTGLPYVIENVPGAPLRADIVICGCQVGLPLRRVRWFETSWQHFELAAPCSHSGPVVTVAGHGSPSWSREQLDYVPSTADYRAAMGIDWMNRDELSEAIPPAYTELVGSRLLEQLRQAA